LILTPLSKEGLLSFQAQRKATRPQRKFSSPLLKNVVPNEGNLFAHSHIIKIAELN